MPRDPTEREVETASEIDWLTPHLDRSRANVSSLPSLQTAHERDQPERESARRVVLRSDRRGGWQARGVVVDEGGAIAENCRHLAVRVRRELERRSVKSVALVSALRDEGKTTLACNLALALASLSRGREVALVDLDLRAPSVATALQLTEPYVGIEAFLDGKAELSEVCVSVEKPALDLYLCWEPQASAHESLVGPEASRLVRELERRYAVVVFDTPPVLLIPDSALILRHVGAYATVAKAGSSRVRAFRSMLGVLPPEKLIGGILNQSRRPDHAHQYGYYAPRGRPGVED